MAGVYADYPNWTVTTRKDRTVRLDDWDKVIGPLYQGALNMSDAEAVLDDLFIATGGHE